MNTDLDAQFPSMARRRSKKVQAKPERQHVPSYEQTQIYLERLRKLRKELRNEQAGKSREGDGERRRDADC